MAFNLFNFYDHGTWNNYPSGVYSEPPEAMYNPGVGRTTEDAQEGAASFGIFYQDAKINLDYRLFFSWHSAGSPTVLTPGKKYRMSVRVKTPAGAGKLGTDGVVVWFGEQSYGGPGVLLQPNADGDVYTMPNGDVIKVATIGQLAANPWTELFVEWIEPSTGPAGYRKSLGTGIATGGAYPKPPVLGEDILAGGKYFIDKITLLDLDSCTLEPGTPAFTKTNETVGGANDGTITGLATSTHVISYALAVSPAVPSVFQSSNVFSGLAPGTYNLRIKDTTDGVDGDACFIDVNGIFIYPGSAPPPPPPPPPPPAKATIDAKPLNENNFVRWFEIDGYKNFNSIEFINCCWDTPAAYRRQSEGRMNDLRFAPIIVTNEKFTFYINFNIPLTDPTFSQWRIALVDYRGLVQDNIATLRRDLFDDGVTYNVYCDEILLSGVVVNRYYRYVIYDISTNVLKFISGEIQLLPTDTAQCDSVRLQYRCTINLRGIRYEALPDFLNIQRIRFYRTDEQDEGVLDQYRAVSSGQLRNVAYELDRFIELEAYYFDDQAHRAAGVWQLHDVNIINDKAYIVKTSYKRDKAPTKSFFKGTIQLFEQAFSTQDRFNRLGNITILSDLLLTEDESRVKL